MYVNICELRVIYVDLHVCTHMTPIDNICTMCTYMPRRQTRVKSTVKLQYKLEGTYYHSLKLHPGLCSSVRMR